MKKIELIIPDSLNELTAKQYVDICTLDTTDEQQALIDSVHIITGLKKEYVSKLSVFSLAEIERLVKKMLKSEYIESYTFELNGIEYGMIPNIGEGALTFGEFLDLSSNMKRLDSGEYDADVVFNFMAVAFRPVINKIDAGCLYKLEPYEGSSKYATIMRSAPASALKTLEGFFLNLRKALVLDSLNYIHEIKDQETAAQHVKTLTSIGAGTAHFENWLKPTLLSLTQ